MCMQLTWSNIHKAWDCESTREASLELWWDLPDTLTFDFTDFTSLIRPGFVSWTSSLTLRQTGHNRSFQSTNEHTMQITLTKRFPSRMRLTTTDGPFGGLVIMMMNAVTSARTHIPVVTHALWTREISSWFSGLQNKKYWFYISQL